MDAGSRPAYAALAGFLLGIGSAADGTGGVIVRKPPCRIMLLVASVIPVLVRLVCAV